VYVSASLGLLHYYWNVKADTREPLVFVAVLAVLLGFRAWDARTRRARRKTLPSVAASKTGAG